MKQYKVTVNGVAYEVTLEAIDASEVKAAPAASAASAPSSGAGSLVAPLAGTILDIKVKAGDSVKKGQLLMLLEAMKMENEIFSPADGKITNIAVTKGQAVEQGAPLVTIA
jgi:biotin carboxyl carrier protein